MKMFHGKTITRFTALSLAVSAAMVFAAGAALAAPPVASGPTIKSVTAIADSAGDLDVSFRETGLQASTPYSYQATAVAEAVCICPNSTQSYTIKGRSVSSPLATITSNRKGMVSGTVTIDALGCNQFNHNCSDGKAELVSITYSNIAVTDEIDLVSKSITGSILATTTP